MFSMIGLFHVHTNSDITVVLFQNHKRVDPIGGVVDCLNDMQFLQLLLLFRHFLSSAEWNASQGLCQRCDPIFLVQFELGTS